MTSPRLSIGTPPTSRCSGPMPGRRKTSSLRLTRGRFASVPSGASGKCSRCGKRPGRWRLARGGLEGEKPVPERERLLPMRFPSPPSASTGSCPPGRSGWRRAAMRSGLDAARGPSRPRPARSASPAAAPRAATPARLARSRGTPRAGRAVRQLRRRGGGGARRSRPGAAGASAAASRRRTAGRRSSPGACGLRPEAPGSNGICRPVLAPNREAGPLRRPAGWRPRRGV